MNQNEHSLLAVALDQASPVPSMPTAIHSAAMAAFPSRKSVLSSWTARFGALAATVVLGFGSVFALQSYQAHQAALVADSDAFAEQLLSERF